MSVAETRALPWYEKRLLIDGLIEEFVDPESVNEHNQGSPTDLAALGLTQGTAV